MNLPPSCGQHFKIGKSSRFTSFPWCITSLQAPVFTLFGKTAPSSANFGNIFILSKSPCGVSIFKNPCIRATTSSSAVTSNASAIRRTLPNVFTNNGTREPFGFSNKRAGPTLSGSRSLSRATRWVDFRNFQNGIDLGANSPQFSFFLQFLDKLSQIPIRHVFLPALQSMSGGQPRNSNTNTVRGLLCRLRVT